MGSIQDEQRNGRGVLLDPGCIFTLLFKMYFTTFRNVKICKIKKKSYIDLNSICVHKVISRKTDILCIKENVGAKIWTFMRFCLSFLHRPQKMSVFANCLCEHIECEMYPRSFTLEFFDNFKYRVYMHPGAKMNSPMQLHM